MSVRLFNAKGEFVDVPENHPRFEKYKAAYPLKEPPKAKVKSDEKPPAGNP